MPNVFANRLFLFFSHFTVKELCYSFGPEQTESCKLPFIQMEKTGSDKECVFRHGKFKMSITTSRSAG